MAGNVVGRATIVVEADASSVGRQINQQTDAAVRGAGNRISSVLGGAAKVGVTALTAIATAAPLIGIKTAMSMQTARVGFETMLGSGKKADSFLKQLADFAAKTPFEFPELQTAASSLISAGVNADKVIPIMTTLGNVTAGMGTGSEGIRRATIALQQMQAAGKITGEDLNQLRDAGIPVYDLLAAATGRSKAAVTELAQAGKLGKKELDQLMLALESGKGLERFAGLMEKQSKTLAGTISTLKDNVQMGLAQAFTPVMPLMQQGVDLAAKLAGVWLPKLGAVMQQVAYGVTAFSASLKDGDVTSDGFVGVMERLAGAVRWVQSFLSPLTTGISDFFAGLTLGSVEAQKMAGQLEGMVAVGNRIRELFTGGMGMTVALPAITGLGGGVALLSSHFGGFMSMLKILGPSIGSFLLSPLGLAIGAVGALTAAMMNSGDGGAAITAMLQGIVKQVVDFAAKFGSMLPMLIDEFLPAIVNAISAVAAYLPSALGLIIQTLVGMLPAIASAAVTMFSGLIRAATAILPAVVQAVVNMVTQLAGMLPTLVPLIVSAGMTLLNGLVKAANTIIPAVVAAITNLVTVLVGMLPTLLPILVNGAIALFTGLITAITRILPTLLSAFNQLIQAVISALPVLVPALLNAAITLFMALVNSLARILPVLIQAAISVVNAVVSLLPTLIPVLINAAVRLFTALVQALPIILPAVVKGALAVIDAVLKLLPTLIPILIQAAVTLFRALVTALPIIIPALLSAGVQVIGALMRMLPTLIPQLFAAALSLFRALIQAVPQILGGLLSAFGSVLSSVWRFISGTFTDWRNQSKAKFDEIVRWIGSAWDNLKKIAAAPIRWVIDTVLNGGLIKAFNWLSDKIGGPHISPISFGGFEKGGVIPGLGTRKDSRLFAGRPGESVMVPEWTKAMGGPRAIQRMNYRARHGFTPDLLDEDELKRKLYGDRAGGIIEWVKEHVSAIGAWIGDKASAIYKAVTNPIGFVKDFLYNTLGNWVNAMPGGAGKTIAQYGVAGITALIQNAEAWVTELFDKLRGTYNTVSATSGVAWPVGNAPITANWPNYPSGAPHNGIDFGVPTGTLVKAFRAGTVIESGWNRTGYGNAVRIAHAHGYYSIYGHNQRLLKKVGDFVAAGTPIAFSDSTGNSTGPHLHFGIGKNGAWINPWPFLRGQAFDHGGWLPPKSTTLATNNTNRRERVGFEGGGGDTYVTVQMTVSVDDLAKMSRIGDFLDMLDKARVEQRKTERSGRVSA